MILMSGSFLAVTVSICLKVSYVQIGWKMTIFFELGYLLIALASAFDLINFTETLS